jgi:iron complex outermembrane receptor protein
MCRVRHRHGHPQTDGNAMQPLIQPHGAPSRRTISLCRQVRLRRSTALAGPALVLLCLPALIAGAHAQEGAPEVVASEQLPTVTVVRPAGGATQDGPLDLTYDGFIPADTGTISTFQASNATLWTSDSGSLIDTVPGGASWGAGGVSSLPAVNGMSADQVQVSIDGMLFGPACPNMMNPPLSYVNPAMIGQAKVYAGTAPVSIGGDYTGARIDVTVAPPTFAETPEVVFSGSVSGYYRSNGNVVGVDVNLNAANDVGSINYTGGWVQADDYKSGNGTTIKSTMYETQNHALSLSRKLDEGLVTFQLGGQFIPYQGYVNQYMDMVDNKSFFVNGALEKNFEWGQLEANAFYNHVRHTMGFIAPDKTGDMPMDTQASDMGYRVAGTLEPTERDIVRIGNEVYYNQLDDWWPPVEGSMMMGPDTFWNINDGQRLRVGAFAEWERALSQQWTAIVGARSDVVWMNTGDVQGYNEMMYGANAAAFNALDHARTDINIDGSAILRYQPDAARQLDIGLARKTRSPNLYERYSWSTSAMAMKMIGWFGDGNGYVGNIDLEPEKAHTASLTATWRDPVRTAWEVRVSPYASYVADYIDVRRCALPGCLKNLPDNLTATEGFVYLQFANYDAYLYGVNIDGRLDLWENPTYGRGVFRGNLNFVRGQRVDGVNLYHIMPVNATLALDHVLGNWTTTAEVQLVGAKTEVSEVHNELETDAYALFNLRTSYQQGPLKLDLGIENLFDTEYDLPLGGANLVNYQVSSMMGTSPAWGYGVAGPGRSFNARLTVSF